MSHKLEHFERKYCNSIASDTLIEEINNGFGAEKAQVIEADPNIRIEILAFTLSFLHSAREKEAVSEYKQNRDSLIGHMQATLALPPEEELEEEAENKAYLEDTLDKAERKIQRYLSLDARDRRDLAKQHVVEKIEKTIERYLQNTRISGSSEHNHAGAETNLISFVADSIIENVEPRTKDPVYYELLKKNLKDAVRSSYTGLDKRDVYQSVTDAISNVMTEFLGNNRGV